MLRQYPFLHKGALAKETPMHSSPAPCEEDSDKPIADGGKEQRTGKKQKEAIAKGNSKTLQAGMH